MAFDIVRAEATMMVAFPIWIAKIGLRSAGEGSPRIASATFAKPEWIDDLNRITMSRLASRILGFLFVRSNSA
jgi:hypothetical protein